MGAEVEFNGCLTVLDGIDLSFLGGGNKEFKYLFTFVMCCPSSKLIEGSLRFW